MYVEGTPPLYISYVSPEKTKQDQHHKKLEPAQGIKENKCKQWKEVKEHNLL